ncbi:MAG: DUF4255 domain-containing protein [Lachnospiraceae bacterium]|nr:DUF4255 domain-containing protein [Lachnospiraceae bacterium]
MSCKYVITKTGTMLTEMIGKALSREYGIDAERIGMGLPGEDNSLVVCIYMYDIRKNFDMNDQSMNSVSPTKLRYPSKYYDLYYMIVPYSDSDVKFRAKEECRLIDLLLQSLGDFYSVEEEAEIGFSLIELDFDDKMKIWNGLNIPYHTALYGKAGPIEIESVRTREVKRVTNIQMDFISSEEE